MLGLLMKKMHNSFTILLVILLLLFSCSSGEKGGSGKGSALNIKGFSLGMDLDAAKENAINLFGNAGIVVNTSEEKKMDLDGSYQLQILRQSDGMPVLGLSANADRRLTRFSFYPEAVDLLLGLQGQDDDSIAQRVMADFNLPDLTRDDSGKWEYREVEGISIKLLIKVSYRYFTVEGFVFD